MPIDPNRLVPGGALLGPVFAGLTRGRDDVGNAPPSAAFGPFRAVRELGRGGMAVVYLGERVDGGFEQQVALKLVNVRGDNAVLQTLFRQERQLLARLVHPNIARLLDGGQLEDGRLWFALDLVDGQRIDQWCRDRRLPVAARLALFRQTCEAVAFAHARLAIHRDIKPSNILVSGEGQVKLLDFGIAALLDEAGVAMAPTQALTPGFASPEQERGEAATTASDIWQLGRLLVVLVAGDNASDAGTQLPTAALGAAAGIDPTPVVRPADRDLAAIIARATADHPEQRYGTVAELIGDLDRRTQRRPVLARQGNRRYRLGRFLSRRRWPVAGIGLAVAMLATVTIVFTVGLARERDAASREAERANAVLAFLNDELLAAANPYEFGADARVLDVLERARAKLDAGAFAQAPQIERALRHTLGTGLKAVDRYDEAARQLQRALTLADAAGVSAQERLATREALADNAFAASDYAQAQRRYRELIEELSATEVGDGRANLRLRLGWVQAYRFGGALDASIAEYDALIAAMRAALPAEDPLLVSAQGALGDALRMQGKLPRATEVLSEALASSGRVHGDEDSRTVALRQNLAVAYRHSGRLQEATALQTDVVAARQQHFGAGHQETLNARNELASMLQDGKRYVEAETIFREVLGVRERLLGDRHQNTRNSLNNLGLVLSLQGRLDEAEPLYRRALAIEKELLGHDHLDVLILDHNLAGLERKRGQLRAAEARHRDVIMRAARSLAQDRPELGLFRAGLAQTLQAAGRYREAAQEYDAARANLVEAYGAGHPRVARLDEMRAELDRLVQLGRPEPNPAAR